MEAQVDSRREKVLDFLFKLAKVEPSVSDILLVAGSPAVVRSGGLLKGVGTRVLLDSDIEAILGAVLPSDAVLNDVVQHNIIDYDCSFFVPGLARFRVNVFYQLNKPALVLRQIPVDVPTIEMLNLPTVLRKIAEKERGLVLVTGINGSGKSSTLAAMIDHINATQRKHIITIEDPVEFLHRNKRSMVHQRQVGSDTGSFADALRAALRQSMDVILVGEMRDLETMQIALRAAETGHMVFSTLHTQSAAGTINRIIDVFEPHQQHQIRLQLAENTQAIISQRLLPRKGGGQIPAVEVLTSTPRVKDFIRNPEKTGQLLDVIEEGAEQYGMQSFDQHLKELFIQDQLDLDTALKASTRPTDLLLKLRSEGYQVDSDSGSIQEPRRIIGPSSSEGRSQRTSLPGLVPPPGRMRGAALHGV